MTAVASSALLPVYSEMPVRPVRGHGSWLVDADGSEWLDAYGGHAVASTGHSHPDVVRAIADQAATLLFYSAVVPLPVRDRLADALAARCPDPLRHVFFCNSGAEANENAIGLARKRTGRQALVSLEGGWHGRTPGALSITHGARYEEAARRAGVPLSTKVPFNDIAALDAAVTDRVAAVVLEPVQGMQGARDCSVEYLAAAREITRRAGAALIFDEIQCGVGRSGAFTAAEAFGCTPDAITMAKGLAAGLPIGAVVINPWLAEGLAIGDLGSTFGGGPVVCAAALANLEVIDRENLLENTRRVGRQLREGAETLGIGVQGRGLLIGLRLGRPAKPVQTALYAHRILTGTSADPEVLRLMPPLNFSSDEAAQLLTALGKVLG
ncbi:MAG: aminotransferase class III-fold pyridoxal phosphate-dependent enzyme [Gemmatimonadota bacterium]